MPASLLTDRTNSRAPYRCLQRRETGLSEVLVSGRLTDGGHIEIRNSQCRHRRPAEVVAPFPRHRVLGSAGFGRAAEQVDRGLVEPEVRHRAADLTVLDEVHAVAG